MIGILQGSRAVIQASQLLHGIADNAAAPHVLLADVRFVGLLVECKLHNVIGTGMFKGAAKAKFATAREAIFAARVLHNTLQMGRVINVYFDVEWTAKDPFEPV